MELEGYWVSEKEMLEAAVKTHIRLIIDEPGKYGLTEEYIRKLYSKYKERYGTEGRARRDIIKEATRSGWIRVRHYARPADYWSIQFDDFEFRKEIILNLLRSFIWKKELRLEDKIRLTGFYDGFYEEETVGGILRLSLDDGNIESSLRKDAAESLGGKGSSIIHGLQFYDHEPRDRSEVIFEDSLNRIYQLIRQDGFAIIKAVDQIDGENAVSLHEVMVKLASAGFGYLETEGMMHFRQKAERMRCLIVPKESRPDVSYPESFITLLKRLKEKYTDTVMIIYIRRGRTYRFIEDHKVEVLGLFHVNTDEREGGGWKATIESLDRAASVMVKRSEIDEGIIFDDLKIIRGNMFYKMSQCNSHQYTGMYLDMKTGALIGWSYNAQNFEKMENGHSVPGIVYKTINKYQKRWGRK